MAAVGARLYGARGSRKGRRGCFRRASGARRRSGKAPPDRRSRQRPGARRLTMTRKQRRLVLIGSGLAVLAVALILVLSALKDSIVFFNSPTDVVTKQVAPGTRIRLGGLVEAGSVTRGENLQVRFQVTDGNKTIPVNYQGILPDLFREGQGVIAEGTLDRGGAFKADSILAKHDETYMPKEVADSLKKTGHWKDDYDKKSAGGGPGKTQ